MKLAKSTFIIECLRSVPTGLIDSCTGTFFLLIALQALDAGSIAKSLIVAGVNLGLLITPWIVLGAERSGKSVTKLAAGIMLAGAAAAGLAALFPVLPLYVPATMFAAACVNAITPLLTPMYQNNYPAAMRGRYVAWAVVVRVAVTAVFGELAGQLLTTDPDRYRLVLFGAAAAFALAAAALWAHKTGPVISERSGETPLSHLLHSMSFIKTDRLLRSTLASWMFMGFANLMMVPLRVEYLANPRYGLSLSAQQVALLTIVIPAGARLVLSPFFGWIFDRVNFFMTRVLLNLGFALSILAFFTGNSWLGLLVGALLFGIAVAGGDILWSLWVTKFAPPDRVANYMSVHTFFTGVRGVLAPIVAFQLITQISVSAMGWFCAILIGLASLILIPEIRSQRNGPQTAS